MSKLSSITPVASLLAVALTGAGLTACSTPMKPVASMTAMTAKAADASCGEGKCGAAQPADAAKAADAKCGEAKCGGAK